jgi:hypothetical protein
MRGRVFSAAQSRTILFPREERPQEDRRIEPKKNEKIRKKDLDKSKLYFPLLSLSFGYGAFGCGRRPRWVLCGSFCSVFSVPSVVRNAFRVVRVLGGGILLGAMSGGHSPPYGFGSGGTVRP